MKGSFLCTLLSAMLYYSYGTPSFATSRQLDSVVIYSAESPETNISHREKIRIYNAILALWDELNESSFATMQARTPNGHFHGQLKEKNGAVYLEVLDKKTHRKYLHPLDPSFQDKFGPDFSHLPTIKLNLDDLHFADAFNDLTKLQEVYVESSEQFPKKSEWTDKSLQTLEEIVHLYNEAQKKWREARTNSELSEKKFLEDIISHDHIQINLKNLGSGELNAVDNIPFIRVLHKESQLSFVFVEKDTINFKNSPHWRQYLARQHIMAGETRLDGGIGRDVIIIDVDKLEEPLLLDDHFKKVSHFTEFYRHKQYLSRAWWKDYWFSIAKRPTLSTAGFGLVNGLAQGTMATSMALLHSMLEPDGLSSGDNLFAPAKLAAIWGGGITAFVSSYRNWTVNVGHKHTRVAKSILNNVMFYYTLSYLTSSNGMALLNPFELQGLIAHGMIWYRAFLGNLAKPFWYDITKSREQVGLSRKPFSMKLLGGKVWRTKVPQSAVETQAMYLVPFSLQMLDFLNVTIAGIPFGKALFLASIPGAEFLALKLAVWMAKKTRHPKAIEIAKVRRKSWYLKKAYFKKTPLRRLIHKRFYAKLTFNKRKHIAYSKLLSLKYPEYFIFDKNILIHYREEKHLKVSHFEIPHSNNHCVKSAKAFD